MVHSVLIKPECFLVHKVKSFTEYVDNLPCGSVIWTCNQQVTGSTPGHRIDEW